MFVKTLQSGETMRFYSKPYQSDFEVNLSE